jgi:3-oxoacyl-[acyl-carrier protein] reductase
MTHQDMQGLTAVVTGAARAIGQRIAITLAEAGADVVSVDLADSSETIAQVEATGRRGRGIVADVTDQGAMDAARDTVLAEFGRVDALVNNAGVFATMERRPFWEIPLEEWEFALRVNLTSTFVASKSFSAPMRDAGRGRIVNVSSNTVTFGMPNFLHYLASKAGVIGVTRGMANELGPYGIGVNAVGPGLVTTEVTASVIGAEYLDKVAQGQALKRRIEPQDVADAVAFLCSPGAEMITGQTMLVNGGASMGPA